MHYDLDRLVDGIDSATKWPGGEFDDVRRWSYGDVENNGVYYHPNLTHYAHQVFEEVFFREQGIHYADLSGRDQRHQEARQRHAPPITSRMTFPVEWLHQWMHLPMYAGDMIKTWIDTIQVADKRVGGAHGSTLRTMTSPQLSFGYDGPKCWSRDPRSSTSPSGSSEEIDVKAAQPAHRQEAPGVALSHRLR